MAALSGNIEVARLNMVGLYAKIKGKITKAQKAEFKRCIKDIKELDILI